MSKIRRVLNKLDSVPSEWIFVTLPFLVIYLSLAVYWYYSNQFVGPTGNTDLLRRLLSGAMAGGSFFSDFLLLVYVFVLISSFVILIMSAFKHGRKVSFLFFKEFLLNIGKAVLWLFSISITGATLITILGLVSTNISLEKITWATKTINDLSLVLFKTEVSFFLQSIPYSNFFGTVAVYSYMHMSDLFLLALVLTLLLNSVVSRKLIFALLIAPAISLPIWFMLPALSPFSSEIRDVLQIKNPVEVRDIENKFILPVVEAEFPTFDKIWIEPVPKSYDVSSLPSMHVAWGTIIVISLMSLSRYFAIVLVPWWIFNSLGAIMTFQHYLLDVITGALVGLLSWHIVNKLHLLSERRGDIYGFYKVLSLPSDFVHKWFDVLRLKFFTRYTSEE